MKLYAISDLHLANAANRTALAAMPAFPEDWLILAGDVGEREEHLRFALDVLGPRFRRLIWVPGNHDLWSVDGDPYRGEAKYRRWVDICRAAGVLTPEDPYPTWPGDADGQGTPYVIAPLFTLYDYSFRPPHIPDEAAALAWSESLGVVCTDEVLLHPDPHPSRQAWCRALVRRAEERLERAATTGARLVLINHWPLREDLVRLRRIPSFSIWCGTTLTEDWHVRFPVDVVVYGHLHIKATHFRDGVRFEEVSLGYPRDWNAEAGAASYLRQILPLPSTPMTARP